MASRSVLKPALIVALTSMLAWSVDGYEQPLHQKITRRAFRQALQRSDFLADLGVNAKERGALEYAIAQGAFDEDLGILSLNHFFDPANKKRLTVPVGISGGPTAYSCTALGFAANEWASMRLPSARDAHYWAWAGVTQEDRDDAIRTLFYRLGHVMHLVQDMAQPEHTRNDQHRFAAGALAASLYERWTGDNLVRFKLPDGTLTEGFFIGFDLPRDTASAWTYDRLFTWGAAETAFGLADLTNRNYVTQDTNYSDRGAYDENYFPRCAGYLSPKLPKEFQRQQFTMTVRDTGGSPKQIVFVEEIYTTTYAHPRGRDVDSFHTIRSALDHETVKYNRNVRVFSLDDNSWNIRAANLLPKAVGYSAGVLNYFFRNSGSITSSWNKDAGGWYRVVLTNQGAEKIRNARVEIFARDPDGDLRKLTSQDFALIPCKGCGSNEIEMVVPALYEAEAHIVVRGDIGDETKAVIGLRSKIPR